MSTCNRVKVSRLLSPILTFSFIRLFVYASIVTVVSMSCKEEKKSDEFDLAGYWEIVKASRNNKPTLTLEKAHINFENDSTLSTNLLRKDIQSPYVREGNIIKQSSPELIEYEIVRLAEDSLQVHTVIRGYDFDLHLIKVDSLSDQ